jgi:hypothetical protein
MGLIRKMVLRMEEHPSGFAPAMAIEGYTTDQIGYHAYLLVDAGLAVGCATTHCGSTGPECMLNNLTSAGHDFADSVRAQYIWDEVMEDMRQKGIVSATLDVVKKMLDKRIRKHLDAD